MTHTHTHTHTHTLGDYNVQWCSVHTLEDYNVQWCSVHTLDMQWWLFLSLSPPLLSLSTSSFFLSLSISLRLFLETHFVLWMLWCQTWDVSIFASASLVASISDRGVSFSNSIPPFEREQRSFSCWATHSNTLQLLWGVCACMRACECVCGRSPRELADTEGSSDRKA